MLLVLLQLLYLTLEGDFVHALYGFVRQLSLHINCEVELVALRFHRRITELFSAAYQRVTMEVPMHCGRSIDNSISISVLWCT